MSHPTPTSTLTISTDTMTPQEALAIIHRFHEAVGWHLYEESATQQEQLLRTQIWSALQTLCVLVHGEAPLDAMRTLCDVCYLRYPPTANPLVSLKDSPHLTKSPCTPCLERLKAEGRLAEMIDWKTGEVMPC